MKFILELLAKLGLYKPLQQPVQPINIIKEIEKPMKINDDGLNLLKSFEGCKLTSYKDIVGILTIGYGHTGSDVKENQTITQSEADEILKSDLERFEKGVLDLCKLVTLNPNQFSALVCFSFNVGLGALKTSTLLKLLNTKEFTKAADEFLKWNKAGGKEVSGLTSRREAERQLFLK